MSVAIADLWTAINRAWDASDLNEHFRSFWPSTVTTADYPVLHDQEATPHQPFPYCVLTMEKPRTITRMTGNKRGKKQEMRDVLVTFAVQADTSGTNSAKQMASALVENVMKVFGGHPSFAPSQPITLSSGGHLITQYQSDWCERTQVYKYQWSVTYLFRVDVPVMVSA